MKRYLVFFTFAFIAGILAASYLGVHSFFIVGILLLSLLVRLCFGRIPHLLLAMCMIVSFLCGSIGLHYREAKYTQFTDQFFDRSVVLYGRIVSDLSPGQYYDSFDFQVKTILPQNGDEHYSVDKTVIIKANTGLYPYLKYGDYAVIYTTLTEGSLAQNFDSFDYRAYLKNKDIAGIGYLKENDLALSSGEAQWQDLFHATRSFLLDGLDRYLSPDNAAFMKGFLLSDKSTLPDHMQDALQKSGVYHIVSASGMHISIVMMLLLIILRRLRVNERFANSITVLAIVFFMALIGFTPSILRAGIMCILALLGQIIYRKTDFFTSLSVSALIILIINPYSLFDAGFILSYSATIGISVFSKKGMPLIYKYLPGFLGDAVGTSLAATIASLPFTVLFFHYVPVFFLLSNIVILPFCGIIFVLAFFISALSFVLPPLGYTLAVGSNFLLDLLMFLLRTITNIPYATIRVAVPSIAQIALYYGVVVVLYLLIRKKPKRQVQAASLVCALLLCINITSYVTHIGSYTIEFINVGQGDSVLITCANGERILIDCARPSTERSTILTNYLETKGINTIDKIYLSHGDSDHSGGLENVLLNFNVSQIFYPDYADYKDPESDIIRDLAMQSDIDFLLIDNSYTYQNGELSLRALSPWDSLPSELANDNNISMVLRGDILGHSFLFTGDIDVDIENLLLDHDIDIDILKVAHHGSRYSSGDDFLAATTPLYSIISVGNNTYGHPTDEALQRLEAHGSQILRTDQRGTILFYISRNSTMEVRYVR